MVASPKSKELFHHSEKTISIADILLILARQIKVIIIVPTFLCIFTIVYVLFFASPVYTSSSKIMSSSSSGGISQAVGLAAQFGFNLPSSQSEPNWVYPEIIKSRTLARSMLKREFESDGIRGKKTLLQILSDTNEKIQEGVDTLEIMGINKFLGMINISEDIRTGIITLDVSSPDPKLSAQINQALIEELDAHQDKYNKAKTSKTRQFIEERVQNTEKELKNAENSLREFMDRNRRIENSPALQLEQQRLTREVTVLIGVFTTLKQQLETTKIEEVKDSEYVVVLDPPEVPLSKSSPKKRSRVFLAGIVGIGLGLILAFLREYAANTNQEEKDKIAQVRMQVSKNVAELFSRKK